MDLPCCRAGRTSPSCLLWEDWLFVLTLNTKKKWRSTASITAITASQFSLTIWRIADTYREQEIFNRWLSTLKWVKVKMLRMNTPHMKMQILNQTKPCQSTCNLKQKFSSVSLNFFIDQAIKYICSWSWYKHVILKQVLHLQVGVHHPWLELKTNIKNMYIYVKTSLPLWTLWIDFEILSY